MKQLSAIFWKEWHDARWFLAVALFLFIGMPVIGALEAKFTYSSRFYFNASLWVIPLGGILAILTAIGITCRDLGSRLEDFWRSRAINPLRWISVKYLVGLAVVLVSCIAPLLIELSVEHLHSTALGVWSGDNQISAAIIFLFTPLWIALYSVAFLCGCLVRRTAHATMLALAGMLLIYFLPLVLPFMRWLSLSNFIDADYLSGKPSVRLLWLLGLYTGGMLAIGLVGIILSLIAVVRGWRIQSGTKMMYWSVGSTVLLLFSTVAFQLGTNLQILQQLDLPAGEHAIEIQFDGARGVILTQADPVRVVIGRAEGMQYQAPHVRLIDLKDDHLTLGPPLAVPAESLANFAQSCILRGHVLYWIFEKPRIADGSRTCELRLTDLDVPSVTKSFPIPECPSSISDFFVRGDRLYIFMGYKLAIFDIHAPTNPQLVFNEVIPWGKTSDEGYKNYLQYRLPIIPGFTARECLETILRRYRVGTLNGDKLSTWAGTYKLDLLKDGEAHFTLISNYEPSVYEPSIVESVFGNTPFGGIATNGLLYTSHRNNVPGKEMQGITVFNMQDPRHPRTMAHFAVPSKHSLIVYPLPDGRSIVGGDKLYLLGKPPGWK